MGGYRVSKAGEACSYSYHLLCCDVNPSHLPDFRKVYGIRRREKIKAEGSCPGMERAPVSYGQSLLVFLGQLREVRAIVANGGNQNWLCSENPSSREFADV